MRKLFAGKLSGFLCCIFPVFCFAQGNRVSVKITDEKNNPVPFANIVFQKGEKGFASDTEGAFTVSYSEHDLRDSLHISAIGFETKQILFSQLLSNSHIILFVRKYELNAIPVSAREAENLVEKAIEKIPENYPQSPYLMEAFYRQFHRENGNAARLIEASLTIYDPGYTNLYSPLLKEKFEIVALRRSKVIEKNGFEHDDHLVDLLKKNFVHYTRGTILNAAAIDYFNFEKAELQQSDSVTCVNYFYKNPDDPKIRWGNLFISDKDFAILSITEKTAKNKEYNPRLAADENSEWHFFEGEMSVSYKKFSGKYYLDSISFFYRHNIVSKVFGSTDFTVDEYFNLWTRTPDTTNVSEKFHDKKFQNTGGLYSRKYEYDFDFWSTYLPLIEHPLEPTIVSEFEKNTTLEQQFSVSGNE